MRHALVLSAVPPVDTAIPPTGAGAVKGLRISVLTLAIGAGFVVACGGKNKPIRIGLSLPLTDPAVLPMTRGADLALRQINEAGGVNGRPLELVRRDDFGEPDSAVQVAAELYASDVVAVIGSAYSGATITAAPVYNGGRRPLVQLSPSASSPVLSEAGDYTFRICATDLAYGAALAQFAYNKLRLTRAAVLYVNDEYGRGIRITFSEEFKRLGGEVVEADPFLFEKPDVSPYLDRIRKEARAQLLLIAANQAEGIPVLSQVRGARLGLPLLAGDGFVGIEARDTLADGVYISAGYLPSAITIANRTFVNSYRRAFPEAGLPDQGGAATYDAVRLIAAAITEGGASRSGVRQALARVGNGKPSFDGVVGRIAFDSNGDVPSLGVRIGMARGGRLVPAD
ncbi:MAG TPA: ABC transporter substrate-binding protein [Gemmatimonadales bacterium]|nr:ABC transporter substrate-binding protein [Gemmatimonadales bacterium]